MTLLATKVQRTLSARCRVCSLISFMIVMLVLKHIYIIGHFHQEHTVTGTDSMRDVIQIRTQDATQSQAHDVQLKPRNTIKSQTHNAAQLHMRDIANRKRYDSTTQLHMRDVVNRKRYDSTAQLHMRDVVNRKRYDSTAQLHMRDVVNRKRYDSTAQLHMREVVNRKRYDSTAQLHMRDIANRKRYDSTAQLHLRDIANRKRYDRRCSVMIPQFEQTSNDTNKRANMTEGTFTKQMQCDDFILSKDVSSIRPKVELDCTGTPMLRETVANHPGDIYSVPFRDSCLSDYIDNCCMDEKPVPNVVHFVCCANMHLDYFTFLSLMSVVKFQNPCLILIHGPLIPYGTYWEHVLVTSSNIIHVNRTLPTHVFGNRLVYKAHGADILRMKALMEYGGIYLDHDEILLRPLHSLRQYVHTQGHDTNTTLGAEFIMAKKNSTFLHIWYMEYKNYMAPWTYNSLHIPNRLAIKYPDLIHIDGYNFSRPNWNNRKQIFNQNYDWSMNYAIHLYARFYRKHIDPTLIRTLNTTLGSVSRHVLLRKKELCVI